MSGNLTTSTFTSSFLSTILGFFQSIFSAAAADFLLLMGWLGNQITFLLVSWGNSFSGYGVFIPVIFTISIGVTILGVYVVLTFVDAGKDMVGE